ncbi:MAG TPA: glycosyltransferase, partial [Chitinophagales bacterium]|nr:glycosyltransferase [Chitinophagales bacterium]
QYIDALVTVNQSLATNLKKHFKLSRPVVVIRNVPPLSSGKKGVHLLRRKFNIAASQKILVFIGASVHPKTLNLETVLAQLGNDADTAFVFICGDNVKRREMIKHIRENGYPSVFFHDLIPAEEISNYLCDCDAGLVPTWNKKDLSYWYALDNKLFNYVMAEIPVLATAQPEYEAIVEKHKVGVCVNPDRPNAYADGWRWILQNQSALAQNLEAAKQELNWKNESLRLLRLYDSLLS